MTLLMAVESRAGYDILVAFHVVCAVVGFGAVALSGIYGSTARTAARVGALDELRRYFASRGRAELALIAVPVLGVAALIAAPGPSRLGQAWVAVAMVLWALATILLLAVTRPAEAALRTMLLVTGTARSEAGPDPAQLRSAGGRLRWSAAAADLIFVVALIVMIIQPGS